MMSRRTIGVAVLMLSLGESSAQACRGFLWERSVFFENVHGLDLPFIAQVSVTKMISRPPPADPMTVPPENYEDRYTLVGLALVQKVIKGAVWPAEIKVAVLPTSCGPHFEAGATGIVAGTFKANAKGEPILQLASESLQDRQKRLNTAGQP
jgi:hypothetical protein